MTLTIIISLWIVLIIAEIYRNWKIIDVQKQRPVYGVSTLLRVSVGFVFWILSPLFFKIGYFHWLAMPPMMALTFWFVFDYGLNQFRNLIRYFLNEGGEPIVFYYLNPKGSWLDQFQCKHPHPYPWFWFKLIIMLAGVIVFYYGVDAIWTVKW